MNRINIVLAILVVWLVSGCASSAIDGGKRAEVEVDEVKSAIALELELNARHGQRAPPGESWFTVLRGNQAAIVTAPHATRPFREGTYRFSDGGGTAALARALHDKCGVTVLYTIYEGPSDPNFYDDNDFKRVLGTLIEKVQPRVVLDIHGSHPYRPYEADIGTMSGASTLGNRRLVPDLVNAFREQGLSNLSHNRFAGSGPETIIKFSSKRNVPAVQLEFSALRVSPGRDDESAHRFAQTLQAMIEFLRGLRACGG